MNLKNRYQRFHKKTPKLAQITSLGIAGGLITAQSVIKGVPLWAMGAAKVLSGSQLADKAVIKTAQSWISYNNTLIDTLLPERDWRIDLPDDLDENKQYLLISNHQSWVDTSIVQYISEGKLPLTRFFTKHDLIYIPFVGQAFYFLDFPMMKRHTKAQIARNPALKNHDIMEAKRACETLKDKPFALLNYLEGTRFTKEKKAKQNSPYQYLLKPKAGGLTLAIQALGQQIDGVLDMTIVYPDGPPAYASLWKGEVKRLGVHVRRLDVPETLFNALSPAQDKAHPNRGDCEPLANLRVDETTKQEMYAWLDEIWQQKDERIAKMLSEF